MFFVAACQREILSERLVATNDDIIPQSWSTLHEGFSRPLSGDTTTKF